MADYEARMEMLPFSNGPSAIQDCHICNRRQRTSNAYVQTAYDLSTDYYLRAQNKGKRAREAAAQLAPHEVPIQDETGSWTLRTMNQVHADMKKLKNIKGATAIREYTREHGVAKTVYALSPDYIPGFHLRMAGQDLMHVEGSSGNISYEGNQMFYVHIRNQEYYTYDELVDAFESYTFRPASHRVPPPYASVTKGTEDSRPYAGGKLHYSASQCFHFALHSVSILEPLLARHGAEKTDLAWLSWLAHVEYVKLALSFSFQRSGNMPALGRAVRKHHRLYEQVPEYKHFMKPKNHAATELAITVSDCGPLRDVWCMAFERFNQSFKRMAEICNFHNVARSLVDFWIMSSAREISSGDAAIFLLCNAPSATRPPQCALRNAPSATHPPQCAPCFATPPLPSEVTSAVTCTRGGNQGCTPG